MPTPNRRHVLSGLMAAGFIDLPHAAHAEPPPEVTTVRLPMTFRAVCEAPKNVAVELLHAEGFTDVRFVDVTRWVDPMALITQGGLDFNVDLPPRHISAIESGVPLKVLAGLHSGCHELIANDTIRGIADLKGKRVGVSSLTSAQHVLVALMAADAGLDPGKDIEWIESPCANVAQLFREGQIDAFLGGAPVPQEMRAAKLGHAILNTTTDRPWSQHFCCMLSGHTTFIEMYPSATKRVLRAILKAADLCVSDPQKVARQMVDGKFTDDYGFALESLRDVRFDRWREFDPEETMRFYALRMREAGFLKVDPNEIIANGADWSFLKQLRRALKA